MPYIVVVAGLALASCNNLASEALNQGTRPTVDAYCVSALAHVKDCDARFPDRSVLCGYAERGECAPYINAAQSQCLHESSCEAVRAALDKRDWLCGVPLAAPVSRN